MAKIQTTFGFKDQITQNLSLLNNTLTAMNQTLAAMKTQMGGANEEINKVSDSSEKAAKGVGGIASKLLNFNMAAQAVRTVKGAFDSATASIEGMTQAYNYQWEQETKLEAIMRKRMNASKADIQAIKDLATAQQNRGIYGDEIILQGAQELASFTSNRKAIETLIPAMNNLIAQQYGYSASGAQFQSTADMMGKVLSGQTGALSRMGYIFSEEEKKMLQFGTEEQKAAALAKIITDNVGRMNEVLAASPQGKIRQLENEMGDLKEVTGGILLPLKQEMTIFQRTVMVDFYGAMNRGLERVVPYIRSLIRAFQEIYTKAKPYIEAFGNTIERLLLPVLRWIRENLVAIGAAVAALATIAVAKAIMMAVAWAAANWQLLLIIGVIALVIAAFAKFGVKVQDIGKIVGAVFGGLYAHFYNQFYVPFHNAWISLKEFMSNVLEDPIGSLKRLFADFADNFLAQIQSIVELANHIPGLNLTWADAIAGKRAELEAWKNATRKPDSNDFSAEKISRIDYVEAGQHGMEVGGEIGARIDSGLDIIQNALKALRNGIVSSDIITEAIESALSFTGSGALSVSDKDSIDISDDFKELIRNRATEKYSIRMSSVTPNVVINGVTITGEMSYEEFETRLKESIQEAANSSLRDSA